MVRLAHSLQGSGRTFGASSLAGSCVDLEVHAAAGDLAAAATLIDSIDAEFVTVSKAVREELLV